MKVLATVIQILTLSVLYFDITLLPAPFSFQHFYLLLCGKQFMQSQNKNICVGTDSTVTSADAAEWLNCCGAVVLVEGDACS